jgi:hypothetical protein
LTAGRKSRGLVVCDADGFGNLLNDACNLHRRQRI